MCRLPNSTKYRNGRPTPAARNTHTPALLMAAAATSSLPSAVIILVTTTAARHGGAWVGYLVVGCGVAQDGKKKKDARSGVRILAERQGATYTGSRL